MNKPRRVHFPREFVHAGAITVGLAALLGVIASLVVPGAAAAQVSVVSVAARQAAGRVVFCVTKDTILVAAVDGSAATAARPPAIVALGSGRMAVVMGAVDWTRGEAAKPTALDEQLPALVQKGFTAAGKIDPLNPAANDIESIGLSVLEFLRPFVVDIHYKLDLAPDAPLVEILLAGYTTGYGPEIWDLRYRVQQKNMGSDYWSTQPMRPAYHQLYPPEKGQPKTFIEVVYPSKLAPLGLERTSQPDPAVSRIKSSSRDIDDAVMHILNGESNKAATRPAEDFLRLAIPAIAGAQAKLAMAALDEFNKFQWVLTPDNAPPAPAETGAPTFRPREVQTDRPSLGQPAGR